ALAVRAPQSFALLTGAVICGALAYWFDADPALLPWGALLAWAAGIVLFLIGVRQLDQVWLGSEPDIAQRPNVGQAAESGALAVPHIDETMAGPGVAQEIVAIETRAETRTEYVVAGAPAAAVLPYARWELAALLGLTLLALLARVVMVQ